MELGNAIQSFSRAQDEHNCTILAFLFLVIASLLIASALHCPPTNHNRWLPRNLSSQNYSWAMPCCCRPTFPALFLSFHKRVLGASTHSTVPSLLVNLLLLKHLRCLFCIHGCQLSQHEDTRRNNDENAPLPHTCAVLRSKQTAERTHHVCAKCWKYVTCSNDCQKALDRKKKKNQPSTICKISVLAEFRSDLLANKNIFSCLKHREKQTSSVQHVDGCHLVAEIQGESSSSTFEFFIEKILLGWCRCELFWMHEK